MKKEQALTLTALVAALATAFAPPSWGLAFDEPPEAPEPTVPYPYPVIAYDSRTATIFNNRGATITIPAAVTTAGAPVDMRQSYVEDTVAAGVPSIFGGGRDHGDFLCTACPMTGGVENASEWGPFIYTPSSTRSCGLRSGLPGLTREHGGRGTP